MLKVDIKKWFGILIYLEVEKGKIQPVSLELIGEAYRLSEISGEPIYGIAVGSNIENVKNTLKGFPLKEVYLYETKDEFRADLYEKALENCIEKIHPSICLIGGTREGRAIAPRAAVNFRTGLTADCTELDINEDGELIQTRPAFGGNIMASILTKDTRPQFATVRPKVMTPISADFSNEIIYYKEELQSIAPEIKIINTEEIVHASITGQDILIVAGRGVKKKEDLLLLQELAELLGGKLASSRALVEKGWMPPENQIGLSGNTVSPNCMITCGVSGSVQFIAGMKSTKNIIAINNDADAGIFQVAHYPICGDLYEIIPELINHLKINKR